MVLIIICKKKKKYFDGYEIALNLVIMGLKAHDTVWCLAQIFFPY